MDTNSIKMNYKKDTNSNAVKNRISNVTAFSALSREGLEFGVTERRLLLHETEMGEKIYIQYPGKETKSNNKEKIRPWDFRPKLMLSNGDFIKDLSFPNIWDDLAEMNNANNDILSVLAAIFFRMAFMEGYKKITKDFTYIDIKINSDVVVKQGNIKISFLAPDFDNNLLREIQDIIGLIRGASLEAYLLYNDMLVQNEDCKYYYRDVKLRKVEWNSKVGRRNTLLSHISVIEYLQGKIKFSEIMSRFQKGMGVAPIPISRVPIVTNNLVSRG